MLMINTLIVKFIFGCAIIFEARPTIGEKVVFDINLFYAEEDVGNYDATGIKWNYSENKE